MFTADMARESNKADFDELLKQLVANAKPNTESYMKIWYGAAMEQRANAVADMLKQRGFKDVEVRDLDSFRFAEVHFSWRDDP